MILSHSSRAGSTFHTAPSKESSQGALSSTAFMKASVTSTERLNMRSRPGFALRLDEGLDVGMVAAQGRHHRAAPVARTHDRPAHRVPDIHEGERPRGVGAHPFDRRAARPQGREVVADAAALLHRQRGLAQMGEDPAHIVRDRPHHKAVEQRHRPAAARTGDDASCRQEFEIGHRRVKSLGPWRGVALGRGECRRHAPPGILDRLVERLA